MGEWYSERSVACPARNNCEKSGADDAQSLLDSASHQNYQPRVYESEYIGTPS